MKLHLQKSGLPWVVSEHIELDRLLEEGGPVASSNGLGQLRGVGITEVDDHGGCFWAVKVEPPCNSSMRDEDLPFLVPDVCSVIFDKFIGRRERICVPQMHDFPTTSLEEIGLLSDIVSDLDYLVFVRMDDEDALWHSLGLQNFFEHSQSVLLHALLRVTGPETEM